jgi:hypothetical protein
MVVERNVAITFAVAGRKRNRGANQTYTDNGYF